MLIIYFKKGIKRLISSMHKKITQMYEGNCKISTDKWVNNMNEQIAQKEKETITRGNFSSLVCK